jgi:hypothetical protein
MSLLIIEQVGLFAANVFSLVAYKKSKRRTKVTPDNTFHFLVGFACGAGGTILAIVASLASLYLLCKFKKFSEKIISAAIEKGIDDEHQVN